VELSQQTKAIPVMLVARAAYWTYVRRHDGNAWRERLTRVHEHVARGVAALNTPTAQLVVRALQLVGVFHSRQTEGDSLSDVQRRMLNGEQPAHWWDHLPAQVREDGSLEQPVFNPSTRL
jgi:hypothetical protein